MFPKRNHLGWYQPFMLVPKQMLKRTYVYAYIAEVHLGSRRQKEKSACCYLRADSKQLS